MVLGDSFLDLQNDVLGVLVVCNFASHYLLQRWEWHDQGKQSVEENGVVEATYGALAATTKASHRAKSTLVSSHCIW